MIWPSRYTQKTFQVHRKTSAGPIRRAGFKLAPVYCPPVDREQRIRKNFLVAASSSNDISALVFVKATQKAVKVVRMVGCLWNISPGMGLNGLLSETLRLHSTETPNTRHRVRNAEPKKLKKPHTGEAHSVFPWQTLRLPVKAGVEHRSNGQCGTIPEDF